ncbi:hypothetical protein [Streptomyces tricolor]|uniref:hypothetical protein n=1 Tax=Streptomyces tricolor TaxID=68277 RepID=UPI0036E43A8B
MNSPRVLSAESACVETGTGTWLVRQGRLLGHAMTSSEQHCRASGLVLRVPPIGPCTHHRATTDTRAVITADGGLLPRTGAEPAPLDVSVPPSAPWVCAALHPAAPLAGAA